MEQSLKVVINTVITVLTRLSRNFKQTICKINCIILNPMMFKLIIVIIVTLLAQRVNIKSVTMIQVIMWTSMVIVISQKITITSITGIMHSSSMINSRNKFSNLLVIKIYTNSSKSS